MRSAASRRRGPPPLPPGPPARGHDSQLRGKRKRPAPCARTTSAPAVTRVLAHSIGSRSLRSLQQFETSPPSQAQAVDLEASIVADFRFFTEGLRSIAWTRTPAVGFHLWALRQAFREDFSSKLLLAKCGAVYLNGARASLLFLRFADSANLSRKLEALEGSASTLRYRIVHPGITTCEKPVSQTSRLHFSNRLFGPRCLAIMQRGSTSHMLVDELLRALLQEVHEGGRCQGAEVTFFVGLRAPTPITLHPAAKGPGPLGCLHKACSALGIFECTAATFTEHAGR